MSRRVGIAGVGAVGARVARQLLATRADSHVVLADADAARLAAVSDSLGPQATALHRGRLEEQQLDALVLATPAGRHHRIARRSLAGGVPVVSIGDRVEDVEALRGLRDLAVERAVPMIAGAGFAPGLTCVLAAFCRQRFDAVDEVHVAKQGTGGPACARQHHRALSSSARDWRNGRWVRRPGGSGRELVWFPEPIGGSDCYRAALPDAILLHAVFGDATRITARMAATRQDRFTAWLPMLSPPHPEGGIGAVRVELRGRRNGRRVVEIVGAVERPAIAAATVAAAAVDLVLDATIAPGVHGLAEVADPAAFLRSVSARGLRAQEFAGLFAPPD